MENEERKNNEIVEEAVQTETPQAEEPELEEYVEQRYDEEPIEAEEPVAPEETTASVEEPTAEETAPAEEEPMLQEETDAEEEPVVEETPVVEEAVPEETTAEEEPVSEETVTEELPQAEASAEESADEEPVTEEPIAEESVTEEPVTEETVKEAASDDDTDLIIEEVILIEEEPKEKETEIIVEEITEEELEDAAEAEVSADDAAVEEGTPEEITTDMPSGEPESPEPQREPELSEHEPSEPDQPTIASVGEPETAEPSEPQSESPEPELHPETKKKSSGGVALKVIGLIVILLMIFVPAGFSLWKGESFRKELINYKNGLSNTYESYYRKEIFPKLSATFIPEWAKQMKLEAEKRAAEEAKRKEEEARKAEEDKKKDILYGVPQVPDGLEYFPLYIDDRMIVYGRDDWLYTAGDTSLDCYAGTNVLSDEEMAAYANLLDTLGNICKAKGIELVMEVAPNKEQVYPEHYPSVTVENQKKRLLVMEKYMRENCSVPFLYPIRELAANKDQYDTYWKYDTHWNSTGAFIGMKAIYEALDRPVNDKDATMHTEATNRGDLAGIAGYTDLYTDYITEYKPSITLGREVFNDSDYDIDEYGVRYISTADNERKLVVCGDSYRVSLAAHMSKDYKYTDVIHRDILNTDGAVARLRALSNGDTLVLICVERWDYRMFNAIPAIITILQES